MGLSYFQPTNGNILFITEAKSDQVEHFEAPV